MASYITSVAVVKIFTPASPSVWGNEYGEPVVYLLIRKVIKHITRWKIRELLVDVDCPHNPDDQSNIGCIHQIHSLLWETGALAAAQKLGELVICDVGKPYPNTKHIYEHFITTISSDHIFQLHHL
jgi:hypothetical protein